MTWAAKKNKRCSFAFVDYNVFFFIRTYINGNAIRLLGLAWYVNAVQIKVGLGFDNVCLHRGMNCDYIALHYNNSSSSNGSVHYIIGCS